MNRLIIIGAGGHAKTVTDIALKNGYTDICFVDDNVTGECMGYPIIAKCDSLENLNDGKSDFVIAIGNNEIRERIAAKCDLNWVTLIHPSAQIASNVNIELGTVIMAAAVVNPCSKIGKHTIINTRAVVEHDNVIDNFAHISPGSVLGGNVTVGKRTQIGLGAIVKNNISICEDCLIGAGAVVVKNITERGVYFGVPAKRAR